MTKLYQQVEHGGDTVPESQCEIFIIGKQDFRSFFVTVRGKDATWTRIEGFTTVQHARAWIKERLDNPTSHERDISLVLEHSIHG